MVTSFYDCRKQQWASKEYARSFRRFALFKTLRSSFSAPFRPNIALSLPLCPFSHTWPYKITDGTFLVIINKFIEAEKIPQRLMPQQVQLQTMKRRTQKRIEITDHHSSSLKHLKLSINFQINPVKVCLV